MTPEDIENFLKEPHIANLATVRPDGSPHVAPVWFLYDGEQVIVMAEKSAVKVRNMQREPRIMLSIATDQTPYQYVLVSGKATITFDDEDETELLRTISVQYMGEVEGLEYAEKTGKELDFCIIRLRPEKLIGWP